MVGWWWGLEEVVLAAGAEQVEGGWVDVWMWGPWGFPEAYLHSQARRNGARGTESSQSNPVKTTHSDIQISWVTWVLDWVQQCGNTNVYSFADVVHQALFLSIYSLIYLNTTHIHLSIRPPPGFIYGLWIFWLEGSQMLPLPIRGKNESFSFPPRNRRRGLGLVILDLSGWQLQDRTGPPSFWLPSPQWKMMTACYSLVAMSPRTVGTCCSPATRNRIWRSWWIFWREGKQSGHFFSSVCFSFFANWSLVFSEDTPENHLFQ